MNIIQACAFYIVHLHIIYLLNLQYKVPLKQCLGNSWASCYITWTKYVYYV